MHDVVVIGGGHAGMAVAGEWKKQGLQVVVLEECCEKPEWWDGDWVHGRGAVVSNGLVAALDPVTADERRMLPCKAIVIAIGRMDPADNPRRLLGITKLGANFSGSLTQIIADEHGRTGAPGIFAAGSVASSVTPHLVNEVVGYCRRSAQPVESGS